MQLEQQIQLICLAALPVLFAITLHEAAHAYAAKHFGDLTAYQQGRISLNPLRHIDPFGTVLLPLITLMLASLTNGLLFGWAKPVPVNFAALRRPKQDMLWVALAGPASNFVMALGWAVLLRLALDNPGNYFAEPLSGMAQIGIEINVMLMVLNLLPVPPLDGGRIMVSLLPHRQAWLLSKVESYGIFIVIALAASPVLRWMLSPFINGMYSLIAALFGFRLNF